MYVYTCPTCNKTVERDMVVFLDHTKKHIVDAIQKKHPEWTDKDGVCKKCVTYYEEAKKPKN